MRIGVKIIQKAFNMGHRQRMTKGDRLDWDLSNYAKRLQANKGSNYEYWNENKHGKLLEKGYSLHKFTDTASIQWSVRIIKTATSSINMAKQAVDKLKSENNYARIICGHSKNKQRIKMFSVIYKKKYKNENCKELPTG